MKNIDNDKPLDIVIKLLPGMTHSDAVGYALNIFNIKKVDYRSVKEGINNGTLLIYNDNTSVYLYRTKTAYIIRFDYWGKGEEKKCG